MSSLVIVLLWVWILVGIRFYLKLKEYFRTSFVLILFIMMWPSCLLLELIDVVVERLITKP